MSLFLTGPEDIQGGNLKLILGLIWTLIINYQIKITGKGISTKKAMLAWINSIIPEYKVTNFSTNWNNGKCICGMVEHIRPGACPNHMSLDPNDGLENCKLGMDLAERLLGIPKVIEPEDLNNPNVDELSIMTYISYFCSPANQLLLDWIRRKIPENGIKNLSTDWNNGINLGALGEACFNGLCPDWKALKAENAVENNKRLLGLMKNRLELTCPISPAEMADPKVDELIIATYLSQFRNAKLKANPEAFGFRVPPLPKGAAIVKDPVTFEIEFTEQTADLKDNIVVTAHGPSADVKVTLKPKDNYKMEASFVPTEPGSYDIVAMYEDENIAGSPFTLPVADPSKCSIFGDVPSDMQVGKEEFFTVEAKEAGIAKLICSFGPNGKEATSPIVEAEVTEQENQQYEVSLDPLEVGTIQVHLKWASVDIPGSPFHVNVCDSSKVGVSDISPEGKVGEPITFTVVADRGECGHGELQVVPRGVSANCTPEVRQNEPASAYEVSFMPWEVGPHKVVVEYGGTEVPGSPFSINIEAAPDAKTCSAAGKGLKNAIAKESTSFQILSPESGLLDMTDPEGLTVSILSSTEEAPHTVTDNQDGTYTVNYTPSFPGDYKISVHFYGNHIPGSPFLLSVVASADALKCRAYGPALHPNSLHIAGNPLDLFVDTTEAGTGDLRVVITGPDESRPKVFIANEDGVYSTKWNVQDPGRYYAHIWWDDDYIPGSPFKIKVSPGPNAAMVKAHGPGLEPVFDLSSDSSQFIIETKDAGIGTLTIRVHGVKGAFKIQAKPTSENDLRTLDAFYQPKETGDYIIAIRWSGTHIPGSPFKISIRDPNQEGNGKKASDIKTKPLPPNIYVSYMGEPQPAVLSTDEDIPEPTPLSQVRKKKVVGKVRHHRSQKLVKKRDSLPDKSTSSLPVIKGEDAIQQQQLAMLRQRGVMHGGGPGGMVVSGTETRMTIKESSSVTSSSTTSGVRHKRQKKKRF